MSIYSDILRSPLEKDEDLRRTLILTGLTLVSFLVIPIFILAGYYARNASYDKEGLMEFGSFSSLFITGVKVIFSHLVVVSVMLLIILIAASLEQFIGVFSGIIAFLSLFVLLYIPAVTVAIGRENKFSDGFSSKTVSRCFSTDYLIALLVILASRVVFLFVILLLGITFIGFLAVPLVHVYRKLVTWRIIGHLFKRGQV